MTQSIDHDDDRLRKFRMGTWRKIFRLARAYRPHACGLGTMAVLIAACDVAFPYLTGRIIDDVTGSSEASQFGTLAAAYFAVVVSICAAISGFILFAGRISSGTSHDIREACFARLQELPFAYYDQRPVGWLMSRLTSDCDRLSRILGWTMLDFLWGFSTITGIAVVMLWLNTTLALFVLTVVPPLLAVSVYYQRRLLESSRQIRRANAEITAEFNENIMGIRTTKALVREAETLKEFQQASGRMHAHCVQNALQSAVYVPLIVSLGSTVAGLALWFGGAKVLGGEISIGTLVTFMNYATLFFQPVQEMARQLTEVQMAQAAAERIVGLLETEPAIKDSPEVKAAILAHKQNGQPLHSPPSALHPPPTPDGGDALIQKIEFRNVTFAYKPAHTVLDGFNLTVEAGETIALVGTTGGGKSTIVSLLCRFYEPTEGDILLNGVDYRRRSLHWWQSNLGIVLQTPHLFTGSVRENIRYGNLEADDVEVEHAARLAGAHEFITEMEAGYDADVGEGGGRLSTGQKQLVALARAILANPQVFVMDEATSSVDTETEHLIQQGIQQVTSGRISFIIAHRLSTIRAADRILVIEHGRIVEAGRHRELFDRRGRYFELYTQQFAEEAVREVAESR